MPKVYASTRIEAALLQRLQRVAEADQRTVSSIMAICIEAHLPALEKQLKKELAALPPLSGGEQP